MKRQLILGLLVAISFSSLSYAYAVPDPTVVTQPQKENAISEGDIASLKNSANITSRQDKNELITMLTSMPRNFDAEADAKQIVTILARLIVDFKSGSIADNNGSLDVNYGFSGKTLQRIMKDIIVKHPMALSWYELPAPAVDTDMARNNAINALKDAKTTYNDKVQLFTDTVKSIFGDKSITKNDEEEYQTDKIAIFTYGDRFKNSININFAINSVGEADNLLKASLADITKADADITKADETLNKPLSVSMPPDYAKVVTLANQLKTNLDAIDERIGEIKTYAQSALAQPNEPYYPENYKNMKWSSLADLKKAVEDKAIALDTQKFSTIDAQKIKQEALDALAKAGAIIGETSAKKKSGNNNYRNAEFENSAAQIQNFIDRANQKIKDFEKMGAPAPAPATDRSNFVTVITNQKIVSTSQQPLVFPDAEYEVVISYKQLNPYCYDQIATNKSFTRHFANKCLSESWAAGDGKAEKAIATENSCKDKYDLNKKINDQQAFHDCLATNWKSAPAALKPIDAAQKAKQESIKAAAKPAEAKTELSPAQKCQQLIAEYQVPETVRNKKIRSDRRAQAPIRQKCVQERWYENIPQFCSEHKDLAKCKEVPSPTSDTVAASQPASNFSVFITKITEGELGDLPNALKPLNDNPVMYLAAVADKFGDHKIPALKENMTETDAINLKQQLLAVGAKEVLVRAQIPDQENVFVIEQAVTVAPALTFAAGTYKVMARGINEGKRDTLASYLTSIGINDANLLRDIASKKTDIVVKENIAKEDANNLALTLVKNGIYTTSYESMDDKNSAVAYFSPKFASDLQAYSAKAQEIFNKLKNTVPNYSTDFKKAETNKENVQKIVMDLVDKTQKAVDNMNDPEKSNIYISAALSLYEPFEIAALTFSQLQPQKSLYQVGFSQIDPNLKDHVSSILYSTTAIANPATLFAANGNIITPDRSIIVAHNLTIEDAKKLGTFLMNNGVKSAYYKQKTADNPENWGGSTMFSSVINPDIVTADKINLYIQGSNKIDTDIKKYNNLILPMQTDIKKNILTNKSTAINYLLKAGAIYVKSRDNLTLNDKSNTEQQQMMGYLKQAKTSLDGAETGFMMLDYTKMELSEALQKASQHRDAAATLVAPPNNAQADEYAKKAKTSANEAFRLIEAITANQSIIEVLRTTQPDVYKTMSQQQDKDIFGFYQNLAAAKHSIDSFYKLTNLLPNAPTGAPKPTSNGDGLEGTLAREQYN